MKLGKALFGFLLLSVLYVAMLVWADSKNQVLSLLPRLAHAMPVLMGFSICSYFFRYLRWRWLLKEAGYSVAWTYGFVAYLAGFAFTATPGKVGELIRIRYFTKVGVPQNVSFGAFVYERAFDLIVVLMLSCMAISRLDVLIVAISFVLIFIALLVVLAINIRYITYLSDTFHRHSWLKLSGIVLTIRDGLSSCRAWFSPLNLAVSLGCGLVAWSITSYGFMWLLGDLGVSIGNLSAFSIYPLAMLAGAASMLPGGIGSTELAIVALLGAYGVISSIAVLSAVGVRFATIWFSVLAGFICMFLLETQKFVAPSEN